MKNPEEYQKLFNEKQAVYFKALHDQTIRTINEAIEKGKSLWFGYNAFPVENGTVLQMVKETLQKDGWDIKVKDDCYHIIPYKEKVSLFRRLFKNA